MYKILFRKIIFGTCKLTNYKELSMELLYNYHNTTLGKYQSYSFFLRHKWIMCQKAYYLSLWIWMLHNFWEMSSIMEIIQNKNVIVLLKYIFLDSTVLSFRKPYSNHHLKSIANAISWQ